MSLNENGANSVKTQYRTINKQVQALNKQSAVNCLTLFAGNQNMKSSDELVVLDFNKHKSRYCPCRKHVIQENKDSPCPELDNDSKKLENVIDLVLAGYLTFQFQLHVLVECLPCLQFIDVQILVPGLNMNSIEANSQLVVLDRSVTRFNENIVLERPMTQFHKNIVLNRSVTEFHENIVLDRSVTQFDENIILELSMTQFHEGIVLGMSMTQFHENIVPEMSVTQFHENNVLERSVTQFHKNCVLERPMTQFYDNIVLGWSVTQFKQTRTCHSVCKPTTMSQNIKTNIILSKVTTSNIRQSSCTPIGVSAHTYWPFMRKYLFSNFSKVDVTSMGYHIWKL